MAKVEAMARPFLSDDQQRRASTERRFFGGRLRQARIDRGLTQSDLARKLGFGAAKAISEIERGHNSVDAHRLWDISRHLGYDMEFFVNAGYQPRLPGPPRNLHEWTALFAGDESRARIHWEIDQRLIPES